MEKLYFITNNVDLQAQLNSIIEGRSDDVYDYNKNDGSLLVGTEGDMTDESYAYICIIHESEKTRRLVLQMERLGFKYLNAGISTLTPDEAIARACAYNPIGEIKQTKMFTRCSYELISAGAMQATETPDNSFIKGLCDRGGSIVLAGASGVGKSCMVNQIALTVASGGKIFENFDVVKPGKVLIIQAENSFSASANRFTKICGSDNAFRKAENDVYTLKVANTNNSQIVAKLDDEQFQINIQRLTTLYDISLVIIDPWSSFNPSSENSNEGVRSVLEGFQTVALQQSKATMLLVHHTSKVGSLRGASSLGDWAETILTLRGDKEVSDGNPIVRLEHTKCRNYPKKREITLKRNDNLFYSPVELAIKKKIDLQGSKVLHILDGCGGQVESQGELKEIIMAREGCSEKYARVIINNACKAGVIFKTKINKITGKRGYSIGK